MIITSHGCGRFFSIPHVITSGIRTVGRVCNGRVFGSIAVAYDVFLSVVGAMGSTVKPFSDIKEAVRFLETFEGDPASFRLPIDDVLQDPIGVNMALVLDHALARGWWLDGYEQQNGFRIYKYKTSA